MVAGTAHEAFLKKVFTEAERAALSHRRAGARSVAPRRRRSCCSATAFRWRSGSTAASRQNCCLFRGGPFIESRYFGEGVGIAVKNGNDALRQGFNWALFRLWEKGRFSDLWLRYFPVSPF